MLEQFLKSDRNWCLVMDGGWAINMWIQHNGNLWCLYENDMNAPNHRKLIYKSGAFDLMLAYCNRPIRTENLPEGTHLYDRPTGRTCYSLESALVAA